ncbi:MAG TPA: hypothetical protein DEA08_00685 [Planctomycetes bacterium]|nr:hypothetical protein [Planctomycetota bacterium]
MSTIQFGGLASGLDTNGIIDAMVQAERIPVLTMQVDKARAEQKKELFSSLAEKARKLVTTSGGLDEVGDYRASKVESSDEGTVVASGGSGATQGVFELEVSQLATATTLASQGYAAGDQTGLVGSGTLDVTVGGETTEITIEAGSDSLEDIRDAINDADIGVTASVVDDGTAAGGFRLVIRGNETGLENAVSLDASGLSGGSDPLAVTELSAARNAKFSIDNLDFERASNKVSDALPGVSLELQKTTGVDESVSIQVELDTSKIGADVKKLVDGFNSLVDPLRDQSAPPADTNSAAGPLNGDFTVSTARNRLSRITAETIGSGDFPNLAALGITTQRDGSLEIDTALLNEAIDADPDAVAEIMADFAARLGTVGEELGKTNEGLFEIRNDTLDAEIDRIDERIDRRETSLESLETRLRRQFTALEVLSNTYQSQAAYLGQLQNLPRLDPNRNR